MRSIVVKYVWLHSGFTFSDSYQYLAFFLKLLVLTVKKKGGAEYLIRLICAELLVVKNASNNILNEIYNFGLLLVLD